MLMMMMAGDATNLFVCVCVCFYVCNFLPSSLKEDVAGGGGGGVRGGVSGWWCQGGGVKMVGSGWWRCQGGGGVRVVGSGWWGQGGVGVRVAVVVVSGLRRRLLVIIPKTCSTSVLCSALLRASSCVVLSEM